MPAPFALTLSIAGAGGTDGPELFDIEALGTLSGVETWTSFGATVDPAVGADGLPTIRVEGRFREGGADYSTGAVGAVFDLEAELSGVAWQDAIAFGTLRRGAEIGSEILSRSTFNVFGGGLTLDQIEIIEVLGGNTTPAASHSFPRDVAVRSFPDQSGYQIIHSPDGGASVCCTATDNLLAPLGGWKFGNFGEPAVSFRAISSADGLTRVAIGLEQGPGDIERAIVVQLGDKAVPPSARLMELPPAGFGFFDSLVPLPGGGSVSYAPDLAPGDTGPATGSIFTEFAPNGAITAMTRINGYTPVRGVDWEFSKFGFINAYAEAEIDTAYLVLDDDGPLDAGIGRANLRDWTFSAFRLSIPGEQVEINDLRKDGDDIFVTLASSDSALLIDWPEGQAPTYVHGYTQPAGGVSYTPTRIAPGAEPTIVIDRFDPATGAGGYCEFDLRDITPAQADAIGLEPVTGITLTPFDVTTTDLSDQVMCIASPTTITPVPAGEVELPGTQLTPASFDDFVETTIRVTSAGGGRIELPELEVEKVEGPIPLARYSWTTIPGQRYVIQRKDGDGDWIDREVIEPTAAAEQIVRTKPLMEHPNRLWRLVVSEP